MKLKFPEGINPSMYSVIIPTFNRCKLLAEAIDSVLLQRHKDIEIIVVDDGSQDNTKAMLQREYPQVRYHYQENKGPAAARNVGIRLARGNIIAFLDSDDLWLKNKIRLELQLFKQFPDADVIAGNTQFYLNNQLDTADTFKSRNIVFNGQKARYFDWSLNIMKQGPVCDTSGMTFRRKVFNKFNSPIFDENLRFNEDWDFEFRLFSHSTVLLYPQITSHSRIYHDGTRLFYRVKGENISEHEEKSARQLQKQIISRYLDTPTWPRDIARGFAERHQQLEQLMVEAELVNRATPYKHQC